MELNYREDYWPCADGLSTVNAIDNTQQVVCTGIYVLCTMNAAVHLYCCLYIRIMIEHRGDFTQEANLVCGIYGAHG